MYVVDGIAYANNSSDDELKIVNLKIISELCMLVTFSNGEKRIFDANYLTQYPIYEKLKDYNIFKKAYIENGTIMWDDGKIDVGTNTVYKNSYEYEEESSI